jgi:hypothetical protein
VVGAWGEERIAEDDSALTALRRAIATVGGGAAVDPRSDLEQLGVGFVVLADGGTSGELTASRIDAVPSLVAVGRTDAGWLWRITPRTAAQEGAFAINQRARIVDAAGNTIAAVPSEPEGISADIPAGPEGRRLVLAERSDAGWRGELDGHALAATTQGWAQAFALPAQGGHLTIGYSNAAAWPLGALTVASLALVLLLAIPARARRTGRRGTGSALLVPESLGRQPQSRAARRGPDPAEQDKAEQDRPGQERGASQPDDDGPDDWPIDDPDSLGGGETTTAPSRREDPARDDARL